jgi:hypothetical protein
MAQTILELQLKGVKEAQADMQRLSEEILYQKKVQATLKDEMKKTEKQFDEGKISSDDYKKSMAQLNIELETSKKVTRENTAQLKQNIRVVNAQEGSLDQLRASLNLLQKEYGQINKETAEGARKAADYADRIEQLTLEVKAQEKAIGDNRRNVGNYEDAIKSAIGSIQPFVDSLSNIGGATGGVSGMFAALTGGLRAATGAAIGFISTGIGALIAVLAGAAAGVVALTKSFFDYNSEMTKTTTLIQGITNANEEMATKIAIQSGAIADALDKDQREIVEGAKVLVQQFGITYEEALNQMQRGILATNGANEEFIDSIREYSTFFADAGYSVEEFADIVNAGFDLGIYTDKLPDALKEADISLREMTQSTRDAIENAFGEDFASNIAEQVNSGAMSTKEALEAMSQEAQKTGLSVEQAATLTADVFRGAGEDAGGALKIFDAINVSLSDQTSVLDENGKKLDKEIERNVKVATSRDKAYNSEKVRKFTEKLKEFGAYAKEKFFKILIDFVESVQNFNLRLNLAFAKFRGTMDGLLAYAKTISSAIGDFITKAGQGEFKAAAKAIKGIQDKASKAYDTAYNKEVKAAQKAVTDAMKKTEEEAIESVTQTAQIAVKELTAAEIAALEAQKKAEEEAEKREEQEKKRREARRKAEQKRQEELAKIINLEVERGLTESELLKKRLDEKLKELKLDKDITKLTEKELAARTALEQKYADDIDDIQDEQHLRALERIKELNDARIKGVKETASIEVLALKTAHLNKMRQLQEEGKLTEELRLKEEKDLQREILEIQRDAAQEQLDLLKITLTKAALGIGKVPEDAAMSMAQLSNTIAQLNTDLDNLGKNEEGEPESFAEKMKIDEDNLQEAVIALNSFSEAFGIVQQALGAAEKERLREVDEQVKQGVITEEQAANKKERIQRNFARKQQAISILDAITNTALGITNALTTKPAFLAPIQAALAAATGAAQIATIRSQRYAKGGILNGPSHAQGGIPMFSKGGAFYGEAEGGEAVLTKGVMANPALARMASAINVAGGGVPFFANGGVLDPIQSATPTDRAADLIASGLKSRQPVLVVEQLRERENSVDVIESLRTIG